MKARAGERVSGGGERIGGESVRRLPVPPTRQTSVAVGCGQTSFVLQPRWKGHGRVRARVRLRARGRLWVRTRIKARTRVRGRDTVKSSECGRKG